MNKGFGLNGILIAILIILAVGTAGVYVVKNTNLFLSTSNNVDINTPSITILYPNGGEDLIMGETYRIKWETNGNISRINELLGPNDKIIVRNIPNTGYYDWVVDKSFIDNFNNQGIVSIIAEGDIRDNSDDYFKIVDKSNPRLIDVDLKVNGSNFPEPVKYDSEVVITWEANKDTKCRGGASTFIYLTDGNIWWELRDMPSLGSKTFYARPFSNGVNSVDIRIHCSRGEEVMVDSVEISIDEESIKSGLKAKGVNLVKISEDEMEQLRSALKLYYEANGHYPIVDDLNDSTLVEDGYISSMPLGVTDSTYHPKEGGYGGYNLGF